MEENFVSIQDLNVTNTSENKVNIKGIFFVLSSFPFFRFVILSFYNFFIYIIYYFYYILIQKSGSLEMSKYKSHLSFEPKSFDAVKPVRLLLFYHIYHILAIYG